MGLTLTIAVSAGYGSNIESQEGDAGSLETVNHVAFTAIHILPCLTFQEGKIQDQQAKWAKPRHISFIFNAESLFELHQAAWWLIQGLVSELMGHGSL